MGDTARPVLFMTAHNGLYWKMWLPVTYFVYLCIRNGYYELQPNRGTTIN